MRVPYDAVTKKARSRKLFEGSKWLELGYNPKDLWSVSRLHRQHAERVDHPTQKPLEIIERMVLASCPPGGRVLDPFMGSGTTAVACARHGRQFVGYEVNRTTAKSPVNVLPRLHLIMSRIKSTFAALQAQGRKGLIPFMTAGDPDPARTVEFMHALAAGGADVIELGVPFSDPMADGR